MGCSYAAANMSIEHFGALFRSLTMHVKFSLEVFSEQLLLLLCSDLFTKLYEYESSCKIMALLYLFKVEAVILFALSIVLLISCV